MNKYNKNWLFVGLALSIFVSGCCCCDTKSNSSTNTKSTETSSKVDAWVMAQEFVKKQLKSPGSADFGSLFNGTYQDPEYCVEDLGNKIYKVTGWVDAQNSFGAKVRNRFTITVRYMGNDNWRAVEGPVLSEW